MYRTDIRFQALGLSPDASHVESRNLSAQPAPIERARAPRAPGVVAAASRPPGLPSPAPYVTAHTDDKGLMDEVTAERRMTRASMLETVGA